MTAIGPHGQQPLGETASHQEPLRPRTADDWIRRHQAAGCFEAVGYIGLGENYNHWLYRLRRRHFVRLASRHNLPAAARVLDIGTGTGFYIDLYRRLGVTDVWGIDISATAIERLRMTYPRYRFEVCDVAAGLPASIHPESGFDWVSAMDVLFHITEDDLFRAALANCARAVRPGGRLLISDDFPARTLPADANQSYHALRDYEDVLGPMGFRLLELSPVFFIANGQVGAGGIACRVLSGYWSLLSRVIGKSIRSWRPAGEALGYSLGAMLTGFDALLQSQRLFRGFSTKVAVFQKADR
ncbi:MAG TPA: class I SAM-dependent methyltransferase [Phycisphaerae bacterium]|nr:class I SAM-dependent methyltransferase [Phycisphaerae bacterium]